jgi:hypothetical protein
VTLIPKKEDQYRTYVIKIADNPILVGGAIILG